MLTANLQPTNRHPTLYNLIGITWPVLLNYLKLPALSRHIDLGLCFSQQYAIYIIYIIWNCSDLEPFIMFRTNTTCVEYTFSKPLLILIWISVYHSRVFTTGFCNLGSKTYMAQPCLISYISYRISEILLYIHK